MSITVKATPLKSDHASQNFITFAIGFTLSTAVHLCYGSSLTQGHSIHSSSGVP